MTLCIKYYIIRVKYNNNVTLLLLVFYESFTYVRRTQRLARHTTTHGCHDITSNWIYRGFPLVNE